MIKELNNDIKEEIPEVCKMCWIDARTSCDRYTREKCQEDYERGMYIDEI